MTAGIWAAAIDDVEILTPYLAIEHGALRMNLAEMAARIAALGGTAVPHLKTHKSAEISRLQQDAGASAATVATLAEAELAAAVGFERILVAYPPVPQSRLDALVRLAGAVRVDVTCTTAGQVAALRRTGAPFGVFWEVDCGTGRLGTAPGRETAEGILRADFGDRVELTGLLTFAGIAYAAVDDAGLEAARVAQDRALTDSVGALGGRMGVIGLSVGTTPLARFESGTASEYRFGNYVFKDATQVALGGAKVDDCALAVITTVVDVPTPNRLVIDAGSKSLPAELMTPRTEGFGNVVGRPDVTVAKLYEEHGLCESEAPHGLRAGDRLAVLPNHACTCASSHDGYVVYADGARQDWWPVRARRAWRPVS